MVKGRWPTRIGHHACAWRRFNSQHGNKNDYVYKIVPQKFMTRAMMREKYCSRKVQATDYRGQRLGTALVFFGLVLYFVQLQYFALDWLIIPL